MDGIRPILEAIRDGVIDSSSATKPRMQGSMAVLLLWQAALGMQLPRSIDTGIDLITQENVGHYLADIAQ
jgi:ribose transport system substrate-binding protein